MTETQAPYFRQCLKTGKIENPQYLAYIRTLPCAVPGCLRKAVAAHVRNLKWGAGVGQKPWDYCAVPLCDGPFNISHHKILDKTGMADFEYLHEVNLRDVIINNLIAYIESKRPRRSGGKVS